MKAGDRPATKAAIRKGQREARRALTTLQKDPKYRAGCRLRSALEPIVPPQVLGMLTDQTNTYIGEALSEVIRFALMDWCHKNADKLPRRRNAAGELVLR